MSHTQFLINLINENDLRFGAELGVQKGINLFKILNSCPILHMIGIDMFATKEYRWNGKTFDELQAASLSIKHTKVFKKAKAYGDRIKLIRDLTSRAYLKINDASLDFVFIDASHVYEDVLLDIKTWEPKVKENGWVIGHDIKMKSVKKAIMEWNPKCKIKTKDNVWYYKK